MNLTFVSLPVFVTQNLLQRSSCLSLKLTRASSDYLLLSQRLDLSPGLYPSCILNLLLVWLRNQILVWITAQKVSSFIPPFPSPPRGALFWHLTLMKIILLRIKWPRFCSATKQALWVWKNSLFGPHYLLWELKMRFRCSVRPLKGLKCNFLKNSV